MSTFRNSLDDDAVGKLLGRFPACSRGAVCRVGSRGDGRGSSDAASHGWLHGRLLTAGLLLGGWNLFQVVKLKLIHGAYVRGGVYHSGSQCRGVRRRGGMLVLRKITGFSFNIENGF